MKMKLRYTIVFLILTCTVFLFCSCSGGSSHSEDAAPGESRGSTDKFLSPDPSGQDVSSGNGVTIDYSNSSDGYVMIRYSGGSEKIKIQITGPDDNTYQYTVKTKDYETFPLTAGSGSYTIKVLENINADFYNLCLTSDISVEIKDEFSPFLYPNQYVWFTDSTKAMEKGIELSEKSSSDLDYVEKVYEYTTENIEYDDEKASNVPLDYIPDIDDTYTTGKGICFDYASLMSALLRAQGVPTKLVVGYSGTAYHAWISVYTEETGWVDNVIEFNGESWSLMDPTLAANNQNSSVKQYVGDGTNYIVKYNY